MSAKEKSIRVRLTEEEHAALELEAKKSGFLTVSEFVRYMTIGEGRAIQNALLDLKEIMTKVAERDERSMS